jgi:hypothetical protein
VRLTKLSRGPAGSLHRTQTISQAAMEQSTRLIMGDKSNDGSTLTPTPRPNRIAHAGHPSSHALPSGRGLELIYAAHPEATQVAGGRCRVRVCSRAVRGAQWPVRGRVATHLQRGGLAHNQQLPSMQD